ncbi:alpha/beta hydrolase fold protein-like protein [Myriangium duriaei CBS 260.36]|uniref:Alpha/beta hydrolase fold protein-like protein n=1 Tax=Myriangium duriaei CBS 260.36 TaxID=1168546 RepID=A0A9P4MIT5_9PEZI|nr:alpha/beta hydrolase fold protein-like protein [Myriangium duriaei CBS 260.36]
MPSINPTHIDDQHWQHGFAFVDDAREVRIHYIDSPAASKPEKGTLLLIHGYPNTSYQWRHVITPLSKAGYRVIAPDYRGAGDSSHPRGGYDKVTVADDLYKVVHDHLGIKDKIHVIGQDIGGMIAHSYATWHPDHTKSVMWGECPLPGSTPYESGFKTSPGMWHFTFQQQLDLPEMLTQDRERMYIKHFYDRLCFNPTGITPRDVDHYGASFAQPGAMRAGFDLYRAFPQDAKDNIAKLKKDGKCKVPAAALSGEMSLLREVADDQTKEFYESADGVIVSQSGHWTAEENPHSFVEGVLSFVKKHD